MLKQPHIEKYFPLFHTIICQFLVNDTGGTGFEEKITKCDMREEVSKDAVLQVTYFLNDLLNNLDIPPPVGIKDWTSILHTQGSEI